MPKQNISPKAIRRLIALVNFIIFIIYELFYFAEKQ